MYLDPAFGGMLLQIIIAIVAVGGGLLYSYRRKIRTLFSKNKTDESKALKAKNATANKEIIDVLSTDNPES